MDDVLESTVTVHDARDHRGHGTIKVTGADRDAVCATAMEAFRTLQDGMRAPSFPTTYPVAEGWQATIFYWGVE